MNIHALANAAIRAIHPNEYITLFLALGQENVRGIVKPKYLAPIILEAQVQDEADTGLQHTENISQTGLVKRFYVNKIQEIINPQSLMRQKERTGDIILRNDGTYWLITQILEEFDLHTVLKGELLTKYPDFTGQDWYHEYANAKPS